MGLQVCPRESRKNSSVYSKPIVWKQAPEGIAALALIHLGVVICYVQCPSHPQEMPALLGELPAEPAVAAEVKKPRNRL